MTLEQFDAYCATLPHATTVVQWGGAHVWKVGGKVFAIARDADAEHEIYVTFKCSDMSYNMLQQMTGCRPAPYLASRGMKWIQRTSSDELDDGGLRAYLRASHDLIVSALPKRIRHELGLTDANKTKKSKTTTKSPRTRANERKGATQ